MSAKKHRPAKTSPAPQPKDRPAKKEKSTTRLWMRVMAIGCCGLLLFGIVTSIILLPYIDPDPAR